MIDITYGSLFKSLFYLNVSGPDIASCVGISVRYQENSKTSHLTHVKYNVDSAYYSLLYFCDTYFTPDGYYDADWDVNVEDIKRTPSCYLFLGHDLILWFSKKKICVSLSIVQAEYITGGCSCTRLLWMKHTTVEYDVPQDVVTLYYDNMSAVSISKNLIQHFICVNPTCNGNLAT